MTLVTLSVCPGAGPQLSHVLRFVKMVTGVIPAALTTETCRSGAHTLGGELVCTSVCTWAQVCTL